MNYLILGGEFNNKGAEAMTLIAIKNIYEADAQANIYLLDRGSNITIPFSFYKPIHLLAVEPYFLLGWQKKKTPGIRKMVMIEWIKQFVPGKKSTYPKYSECRKIIRSIDQVIDISGYALSSKWGEKKCLLTIDWFNYLKSCGASITLMPQSFGPFEFDRNMKDYIAEGLKKCDRIYAREEQGYQELLQLGLTNVIKSPDSVLLEKNFDPGTVIRDMEQKEERFSSDTAHSFGIIPNARLFDKGSVKKETLMEYYRAIVQEGLAQCYTVYLIPHAGEDVKICEELKAFFPEEPWVRYIDHTLYSFHYEELTRQLDFIVASRYHSIIHAYKEATPAVIIGWSEKYNEVARQFGQEDYIADLGRMDGAMEIFNQMMDNYPQEREKIKKRLPDLQESSCYQFLYEGAGRSK